MHCVPGGESQAPGKVVEEEKANRPRAKSAKANQEPKSIWRLTLHAVNRVVQISKAQLPNAEHHPESLMGLCLRQVCTRLICPSHAGSLTTYGNRMQADLIARSQAKGGAKWLPGIFSALAFEHALLSEVRYLLVRQLYDLDDDDTAKLISCICKECMSTPQQQKLPESIFEDIFAAQHPEEHIIIAETGSSVSAFLKLVSERLRSTPCCAFVHDHDLTLSNLT